MVCSPDMETLPHVIIYTYLTGFTLREKLCSNKSTTHSKYIIRIRHVKILQHIAECVNNFTTQTIAVQLFFHRCPQFFPLSCFSLSSHASGSNIYVFGIGGRGNENRQDLPFPTRHDLECL